MLGDDERGDARAEAERRQVLPIEEVGGDAEIQQVDDDADVREQLQRALPRPDARRRVVGGHTPCHIDHLERVGAYLADYVVGKREQRHREGDGEEEHEAVLQRDLVEFEEGRLRPCSIDLSTDARTPPPAV